MGHFALTLQQRIFNASVRVSLYDAKITAELHTADGTVHSLQIWVHAQWQVADAIFVETNPHKRARAGAGWRWHLALADASWVNIQDRVATILPPLTYERNPRPVTARSAGVNISS